MLRRWIGALVLAAMIFPVPMVAARTRSYFTSQVVATPPVPVETTLDLAAILAQLETTEREPAREMLSGYRIRYQAIQPDRLLIQVETRGRQSAPQREAMWKTVHEKADRAQQIAHKQAGVGLRVSVWLDGEEVPLADQSL